MKMHSTTVIGIAFLTCKICPLGFLFFHPYQRVLDLQSHYPRGQGPRYMIRQRFMPSLMQGVGKYNFLTKRGHPNISATPPHV